MRGFWWEYVLTFPTYFDVDMFFIVWHVGVTQPSFWTLLRRNWYICSCIFCASVEGGKFRSLLSHHLGDISISFLNIEILLVAPIGLWCRLNKLIHAQNLKITATYYCYYYLLPDYQYYARQCGQIMPTLSPAQTRENSLPVRQAWGCVKTCLRLLKLLLNMV